MWEHSLAPYRPRHERAKSELIWADLDGNVEAQEGTADDECSSSAGEWSLGSSSDEGSKGLRDAETKDGSNAGITGWSGNTDADLASQEPVCFSAALVEQLGISVQTHETYLRCQSSHYFSDQWVLFGWGDAGSCQYTLDDSKLAYLQWHYHVLHHECFNGAADAVAYGAQFDVKQVADFEACFGQYDPFAKLEAEEKDAIAYRARAQEHLTCARKWAVLYIALHVPGGIRQDGTIHGAAVLDALIRKDVQCSAGVLAFCLEDDNRRACASLVRGLMVADDRQSDEARMERPRSAHRVSEPSLVMSVGGCVLAAVACGACMCAMPLLWPSVLGTAGHWTIMGVAAASGAALMGHDIQSQPESSWVRVLCGALILSVMAASAGVLSHVALPWLAATCAWSAGTTAASGAGLTLLTMLGLRGLMGCVRGEEKPRRGSILGGFAPVRGPNGLFASASHAEVPQAQDATDGFRRPQREGRSMGRGKTTGGE